ncbi:MAG TPA: hypothetical protein P5096_01395 [Patescibacteria group bacterium]|nr:hypothetical protein [Patescibacteria group bacterium]
MDKEKKPSHVNNYLEIIRAFMEGIVNARREYEKNEELLAYSQKKEGEARDHYPWGVYFINDVLGKKIYYTAMLYNYRTLLSEVCNKIEFSHFSDGELLEFMGMGEQWMGGIRSEIRHYNVNAPEFVQSLESLEWCCMEEIKRRNLGEDDIQSYWRKNFGWDK